MDAASTAFPPAGAVDRRGAVLEAARRLQRATERREPCAPVRDLIGTADVTLAYAVQQELVRMRVAAGARVVGRKVGLTSPAVQAQLGVDRPDFGVLFDDMKVGPGGVVPYARLLQPKVEAEVAFVLGADLSVGRLDRDQVLGAVEYAVAALEVVDSRILGWDITFGDTVADNASSGMFVLGEDRVRLTGFKPVEAAMRLFLDDALVSEGDGSACMGDPLNSLAWLATTARDLGNPLLAGEVVLSGALGPMAATPPGSRVRAEIAGLGQVHATFSDVRSGL